MGALLAVSSLVVLAVIVRLKLILSGEFLFHFDSARDWLWVRNLVLSQKPILVGPWSSLQGVFYGPLTYYLLAIGFVLFDGQPVGGSVYALVVNLIALIVVYRFLKRRFNYKTGLIGLALLAFAPLSLYTATFIFQTNSSLVLGALILEPVYRLSRGEVQALPWLAVIIGLGVQTNLFWTLFLLPYMIWLVYWLKLKLDWRLAIKTGGLFFLPWLPQLLFELRHDFLQTRSLLEFIGGKNQSLGVLASWGSRLIDRPKLFWDLLQQSVGGVVGLAALAWVGWRKLEDKFLAMLMAILGFFLIGAIAFPAQFKIWYVYALIPILAVITAVFLASLSRVLVIIYLLGFGLWGVKSFLPNKIEAGQNMKLLKNQLEVVETVLDWGGNETYAVYTYTQPIYDYPYQYLFWWQRQRTGRGPVRYGYLPDKYDYVLNKKAYDPPEQPFETIFLIMEPDNPASDYRWETWLKGFWNYELVEARQLRSGVRIEKRVKLP